MSDSLTDHSGDGRTEVAPGIAPALAFDADRLAAIITELETALPTKDASVSLAFSERTPPEPHVTIMRANRAGAFALAIRLLRIGLDRGPNRAKPTEVELTDRLMAPDTKLRLFQMQLAPDLPAPARKQPWEPRGARVFMRRIGCMLGASGLAFVLLAGIVQVAHWLGWP